MRSPGNFRLTATWSSKSRKRPGSVRTPDRAHLNRLGRKEISNRIDGIRPHIRHRTRPEAVLCAMVLVIHRLRKRGREVAKMAKLARPRHLECPQCPRFMVQPVRHHELRARALGRIDDALALIHRDRHRLLKQQMNSSVQRSNSQIDVIPIRRREIDRVGSA